METCSTFHLSSSYIGSSVSHARLVQSPRGITLCAFPRHSLAFKSNEKPCHMRMPSSFSSNSKHEAKTTDGSSLLWRVMASNNVITNNSSNGTFDYDVIIIGAGVGGHGAALHAVEKVRRTSIV